MAPTTTMTTCCTYYYSIILLMVLLSSWRSCDGLGTFGFEIHHRFSDPVKGILGVDELPEKGSVDYYVAMAHRDHIIRGRHLASINDQSPLVFSGGNDTYRLNSLGFLHYANVSLGNPSLSFLVALDTGSNLFWLPCDCHKNGCLKAIQLSSGAVINLNIYSPYNSSTSGIIPCNSTSCKKSHCSSASPNCPYKVEYLTNNTSSTGIYVEDLLHLIRDDDQSKAVDANITFGCGQLQTGSFLEGGAPNGLFGLGMDNISVPSTLARLGLASNSFSMCFGPDGIGRIKFGDNGSSDQRKTPFNIRSTHPTYNISITQTTVGKNVSALEFSAIFDSGTSFTSLKDPAYTFISESFNSQVLERRHPSDSQIPFEYCYDLSVNLSQPNHTINITIPEINLTMKGGDQYSLTDPLVVITTNKGGYMYCLALFKNEVINIIGQNFMTGYNIVFDREKVVLGWKASNCYDGENFSTLPISPSHSPAYSPAHSPAHSPAYSPAHSPAHSPAVSPAAVNPEATAPAHSPAVSPAAVNPEATAPAHSPAVSPAAVNPEATANSGTNSDPPLSPPSSYSPKLKPFHYTLAMLLLSFLAIV